MIAMGHKFHANSGIADLIGFDDLSFRQTIIGLIDSGICLVAEDIDRELAGMIGAALHRPWFNEHTIFAQELFWWVEPWARGSTAAGRLIDALEQKASEQGAHVVGMVALDHLRGDAVSKLYSRRDYRSIERAFMKRVG